MSVAGVKRLHDFGPNSWGLTETARRKVDHADLAFARQQRALGRGFQTISRMTGIPEADLRRHLEAAPPVSPPPVANPAPKPAPKPEPKAEPAKPPRAPSAGTPGRKGEGGISELQGRALVAIALGAVGRHGIAGELGIASDAASSCAKELRKKGLLAPNWRLTPQGVAAASRVAGRDLAANVAQLVAPGTQMAAVLLAVADGAIGMGELACRVAGSAGSLTVVMSNLRRKGLMRKGFELTAEGQSAAERLREARA